ncbi:MAG: hypothetical protein ACJA1F_002309 [Paracoccaceae bacterium]|jgi:hypothetical protein
MKRPLLGGLTALVVLSGCATVQDSRLNPFNWFGSSTEEVATLAPKEGYGVAQDRRTLVQTIQSLNIARVAEGAVITAIGLPETQGFWDAELVLTPADVPGSGTLTYEFRISRPFVASDSGTVQSRELSAGKFITLQQLDGVRQITVTGQNNQRSVRR